MASRFRFDLYELQVEPLRLFKSGQEVEATSQTLMLLHCLLQRPGEVVEKSDLLRDVWGHTHLTDAAFARAILRTRQIVDDDGRSQHIIRTVHGRGVMMVAKVACIEAEEADTDSKTANATTSDTDQPVSVRGDRLPVPGRGRPLTFTVLSALLLLVAAIWTWPHLDRANEPHEQGLILRTLNQSQPDPELDELTSALPNLLESSFRQQDIRLIASDPETLETDQSDWREAGASLPEFFGVGTALDLTLSRRGIDYLAEYTLTGKVQAHGSVEAGDRATLMRRLLAELRVHLQGLGSQDTSDSGWLDDPLIADLVVRGHGAWATGDTDVARKSFDAAAALAPEQALISLWQLEVASADGEDPERTSQALLALIAQQTQSLSPLVRARMLERAGTHAWYAGNAVEAVTLLTEALSLCDQKDAPLTIALVRNALSMAQQSRGDLRAAWEQGSLAAAALREGGFHYHLSFALTNLGYLEEDRGRIAAAAALHNEALAIRARFGFRRLLGASDYAVARVLRRSGKLAEALLHVERASDLFEALNQPYEQLDAIEEVAEIQLLEGHFAAAEIALEKGRERAQQLEDVLAEAWLNEVLGRLRVAQGRPEEGVELMISSMQMQLAEGETHEARFTRIALINALIAANRKTEARDQLDALAALKASFSHDQTVALAVTELRFAVRFGSHQQADSSCSTALELARISGTLDREAEAAILCGHAYLDEGKTDRARQMLQLAKSWNPEFAQLRPLRSALAQGAHSL